MLTSSHMQIRCLTVIAGMCHPLIALSSARLSACIDLQWASQSVEKQAGGALCDGNDGVGGEEAGGGGDGGAQAVKEGA